MSATCKVCMHKAATENIEVTQLEPGATIQSVYDDDADADVFVKVTATPCRASYGVDNGTYALYCISHLLPSDA